MAWPKTSQGGLFDRLRSLPIRLLSIVTGRVGADSALVAWGVLVMTAVGFAGRLPHQRLDGRCGGGVRADRALRLRLRLVVHRHGAVCREPAGGAGAVIPGFPLSFVSSAYVPVSTMPGWMQGFANTSP